MSIFKRLNQSVLFSDAYELIKLSRHKVIQSTDKIQLPKELSAKSEKSTFIDESVIDWSNGRSIFKTMAKATRPLIVACISYQILASLFAFATPILMNQFMVHLQNLQSGSDEVWYLVALSLGFGISGIGNGVLIQHYFYRTLNYFQVSTNAVNRKIFNHSLKLSQSGKNKYQIGDIVNFMSSDADAIGDAAITTIDLANAVVLLLGCAGLLFYYIGLSALPALLVMAVLVPMTQKLAKKFMHLEDEMMAHRDARLTLMSQILNAVRVIKYFSWERSIEKEVLQARHKEISARTQLAKAEIAWGLIYSSLSSVVLFTALLAHYLRGQEITLSIVFTCISIFSLMEHQFGGLSRFISRFINIFVSGDRIAQFLKADQVQLQGFEISAQANELQFDAVTFQYQDKPLLQNLNFKIQQGESIAVVGAVGKGKSTLLQLILSELNPVKGQITIPQKWSVGYVPQEAFIVNSSLRENIIFGQQNYKNEDLETALKVSCLKSDILILPAGLNTEIGEKGVNLSGGQKQRVSLARTVLANPDLILLDDPLSAVDPHTEDLLVEHLLFGHWKNKTVICATHRIAHLKKFDRILLLKDQGYEMGTFDQLVQTSEDFKKYIELENKNQITESELRRQTENKTTTTVQAQEESRVTVDEDRAIGSVKSSIYWDYVKSLGGDGRFKNYWIALLGLSALLFVCVPLLQKAWLTQTENKSLEAAYLVFGYGALGLLSLVIVYLNNLLWTVRGIEAGQLFHNKVLRAILKSEIRFFDSTPVGRILQRFSRDVESVDIHLQWSFDAALHSLLNVVISLILIVFVMPLALVFLLPLLLYYYFIQNDYRRLAREVKRLDSLARSPRYAHFKETLQGLTVIRGFKQQQWFYSEFVKKLEDSVQAFFTHYYVNRWFSTRLPIIGAAISMLTTIAITYSVYKNWMTAGFAGLVTVYALDFWKHLNWGVRIFSDLESRMTSVERLTFYGELPSEKEFVTDSVQLSSGRLEFKNVKLRYAEHLPFVLKNVSFVIESGSRAGVIGRTGSGKSTLFQAVYRFIHFDEGDILIDNQSIRSLKIEDLRRNLSVIPQDPTLFMGTLRSNLDRYNEKSDAEIWAVLDKVHLKKFVEQLPDQLQFKLTENGSNFSQGQRQLICLARALLLKVKIIFLDEATASVDLETDSIVQKVLSESLEGITLVTIAHRLSTLKGYDQIIELQNGEVVGNSLMRSSPTLQPV